MCSPWPSIIFVLAVILSDVLAGNVLVFPHDGSHWVNMRVLVEELHSKGHNVTIVRPSDSWYISDTSPFYHVIALDKAWGTDEEFYRQYIAEVIVIKRRWNAWTQLSLDVKMSQRFSEFHRKVCEMMVHIFENKELMFSLKIAKYDMVLTDPSNGGGVMLAHYLGLPLVFNARWTIHGEAHFAIAPSPLSYVPFPVSELTDEMTFIQRVKNMVVYTIRSNLYTLIVGPHYSKLCKDYFGLNVDYFSLFQAADLWLMRVDFVFEFPRPTMPNVIYMGGFQCKPAKPLPQHLEDFVQIIWRYKGDRPATLGNNTLLINEKMCKFMEYIFENKDLMQSLRDAKYDLILTDPVFPGGVMLAHYLNLPFVFNVRWTSHGEGHFSIAPSPLSYVPLPGTELSDEMSFFERLLNILFYGFTEFQITQYLTPHYAGLLEKYFGPDVDYFSLFQAADLWLMRVDFVFEFPRPTMPNVIYMGGFQCKPAKPLPQHLEDFHKGNRPATLGNNTLLVDWMPQNDLLGHPKIKAFIAHGGTNGVQEAIYHGVPIIGLPLIFDQHDNLFKIKIRGGAKIIDIATMNEDTFLHGIQEVLHEPSYRMNMQRLSRLHRDQPIKPLDLALFWIEFVMRHKGAAHLRTESYKMPWYSYHSVDVIVFLAGVVLLILGTFAAIIKCLCSRLCLRTKNKHD
uniref:Uncharacterized protein n=1 Tax=Myripristis murdjan TaxID=586833 RepID=A0A668AWI1_9TELE